MPCNCFFTILLTYIFYYLQQNAEYFNILRQLERDGEIQASPAQLRPAAQQYIIPR